MPKPIVVPKLGLTMRKATVVKWLKNEGESVSRDKPVAVIETEKVSAEVQAPEDGVLLKVLSPKGTVVQVGAVIGFVGQAGEQIPTNYVVGQKPPAVAGAGAAAATSTAAIPTSASSASADTGEPSRRKVSPRAKMLAQEKGVDLSKVAGSGPGNMVMEKDILDHIQNTVYRTAQGLKVKEAIPMSATRKAIAENMTSSLQSMAQVSLSMEVNSTQLESRLKVARAEQDVTFTDLLIATVANVLAQHPLLNSTLEDETIKVLEEINIGVAVAADTGLVVPVIRNADKKTVFELSRSLKELAEKARQGTLTLDEITGGTFTITNLGAYGVEAFTPIINPPQVAILGVGSITARPTVEGGNLIVRPMMTLSLTFDHRVVDGHTAAAFLRDLRAKLESSP